MAEALGGSRAKVFRNREHPQLFPWAVIIPGFLRVSYFETHADAVRFAHYTMRRLYG